MYVELGELIAPRGSVDWLADTAAAVKKNGDGPKTAVSESRLPPKSCLIIIFPLKLKMGYSWVSYIFCTNPDSDVIWSSQLPIFRQDRCGGGLCWPANLIGLGRTRYLGSCGFWKIQNYKWCPWFFSSTSDIPIAHMDPY